MTQHPPATTEPPLQLTLFIAGDSAASRRARVRLAGLLAEAGLSIEPRVVDVLGAPHEAMAQRIFVTPALVVRLQGQVHTFLGDLAQTDGLLPVLRASD